MLASLSILEQRPEPGIQNSVRGLLQEASEAIIHKLLQVEDRVAVKIVYLVVPCVREN